MSSYNNLDNQRCGCLRSPDDVSTALVIVVLLACAILYWTLGESVFIKQPSDVYIYPGGSVSLSCINNETTRVPEWSICGMIYHHRMNLPSNHTYYNRALRFLASEENDGCTYQCIFYIGGRNVVSENATLHIITGYWVKNTDFLLLA